MKVVPAPVCGTSSNATGVGIAFDGDELLLSCFHDTVLKRVNPLTGAVTGAITVTGLPAGEGIGAVSWDGVHHLLWVGTTQFQPHIYSVAIDKIAGTGTATLRFVHGPSGSTYPPVLGLAYDGTDNTVWVSLESPGQTASQTVSAVYHYTPTGTLLGSFTSNLDSNGRSGCHPTGVVVADAASLYLSNGGCGSIFSASKDGTGASLFASVPNLSGSTQLRTVMDLECDARTFAPKTALWEKSAYDLYLNAFEASDGRCPQGGVINSATSTDTPPTVDAGANAQGIVGSAVALSGSAADPDPGDSVRTGWSYWPLSGVAPGASCSFADASQPTTTISCTSTGIYTVTLTATDGNDTRSDSATLTVTDRTLYVDRQNPSCSASAAGTPDQPFCTIGAAAAKAGPGTKVVVAAGTYPETVKPPVGGAPDNPLTFTAAPGATVVVSGDPGGTRKDGFYLAGLSWVTVNGFTVSGPDATDVGILASNSSHLVVSGNHVTGCAHGIYLSNTSDSRVADNTTDHDTANGIYLNQSTQIQVDGNAVSFSGDGIDLWAANGNALAGNVIHDNGSGIYARYSGDNRIVGNVFFGNGSSGGNPTYTIALFYSNSAINAQMGALVASNSIVHTGSGAAIEIGTSPRTTLVDNVIDVLSAAPAIRVVPDSVAGSTIDWDVLNAPSGTLVSWNGGSYSSLAQLAAATGQETHGIQADPGFAAPTAGDLTLRAGSPAVDSALAGFVTTAAGKLALPSTDAFGGARVDDAATANSGAGTPAYADRGAYELRNAGFEAGTAGWNSAGSSTGVTLATSTTAHSGTSAAVLTNSGSAAATCALNDAPNWVRTTAAGTYTGTLWVRADTPGATLKLKLKEWAGSTAVGEAKSVVSLTSDWQPVTVVYTPGLPGSSTLDFSAYVLNAPPGACFYADDASLAIR